MDVRSKLKQAEKIVIKVGTSSLTYSNGKLNLERIERLARVLSDLNNQDKKIVLVSSGAIGVGVERLGLNRTEVTLPEKQASASVGQAILMKIYQKFFEEYNTPVSQILLTKDVMDGGIRKENAQNTFNTLLDMGVIPIVNENDTISTFEIEFGDNDTLSATVASLVGADLLILLTDIDGLFTADPRKDKNAEIISVVEEINEEIDSAADGAGSKLGTGGMVTKISAAKICCSYGIDTVIANGEDPKIIYDILDAKEIGTLFLSGK
ncbi:glutamate 5-kinase ProB [Gottschalkia acidurici 9a]|uniref:Glutamate 5-kinase n=1 Tax=Gottschalkia acidurici (strain ATCC 7906 / DSM 604 / BCRC 14475 / CIP 104303 / KCTC 5404 / NCIMB 10678 / 9a) TaxID=1128398 RepID=K0AY78_GOTA9|nr:glutamate 5-kinase [Gottschalkia acidurici]AFS78199.1 glutamate 5-kinase ProB [Gottschalkia acidurici 9a]